MQSGTRGGIWSASNGLPHRTGEPLPNARSSINDTLEAAGYVDDNALSTGCRSSKAKESELGAEVLFSNRKWW